MKGLALIAVLVMALASKPASAAEAKNGNETTLAVENNYILAPIYLYDHWRWFVLDTARDLTVFHRTFTNHLKSVPAQTAKIVFDRPPKLPVCVGPKFFLAGHHEKLSYVLVGDATPLEELSGATVDGILGLNVLTNYSISLDFLEKKIRFQTNASPSEQALSLTVERFGRLAFSATLENGKHVALGIDTADLGEVSLNAEDWAKAFPNGPSKTNAVMAADSMGDFHLVMEARLPSLKAGENVYTNLLCRRAASEPALSSVGSLFLQRHRVVIDYPGKRIGLERVGDQKATEANMMGIHLKWVRKSAVIASIDPDSPAAKSGLAEGDWILSIGDKSVARMEPAEIDTQFRRGDNETLEIVALHGTKEVTNRVVLKRKF
jgi:hypothetical protein